MNVIGVLLLGFVLLLAASAILQWLWNITMPQVFGLKMIEFWEAFRLLLIAGLLLGGGRINLNL